MAERYEVTSVDETFSRTNRNKKSFQCLYCNFAILLAALFFEHNVVIPRGLFVIAMLVLLLLTILVRMHFAFTCAQKIREGRPVRLLIVGADSYAERAARSPGGDIHLLLPRCRLCPIA